MVLVGAGGAGMSNLVGILRNLGFKNVIGIDGAPSQLTEQLQAQGIQIFSHNEYQIKAEDTIIYSSATAESVEVQEAKRLKKEAHLPLLMWDYFEFLGEMSKYFITVGFTGTNGKSSSSAMAIAVAKEVLPDFGIGILGALVPDFAGKGYALNEEKTSDLKHIFESLFSGKHLDYSLVKKYFFFVEACEYQRHFLTLDLDYAIITNITLDHTDYFKDFADYTSAFETLVKKVKRQVFTF
ncbi:MAG: Mur ligase domain-containing protein, partial [Candidatus Peribacteria bacterium]|nr:Mur ligase domain-containing protein [Candidatus Peribacteria bacterium]